MARQPDHSPEVNELPDLWEIAKGLVAYLRRLFPNLQAPGQAQSLPREPDPAQPPSPPPPVPPATPSEVSYAPEPRVEVPHTSGVAAIHKPKGFTRSELRARMRDRRFLSQAIAVSELLDKPVAMRRRR